MSDSLIHLQSAGADVVIKTRPFAEIVYWGPHLSHFSPQDADSLTRPVANGRLDVDSPVTLMAELGHGLFGAPGIEGHRQGLDASPLFTTSEVRHEGQTLTLVSEDPHAAIINASFDGIPVGEEFAILSERGFILESADEGLVTATLDL